MADKKIYIVGGDGFARECHTYLMRVMQQEGGITFGGFVGEGGHQPDLKDYPDAFKGDLSTFCFQKNDYVVLGSGNPVFRKKTYEAIKEKGVPFFTLIDPSTKISSYVELGEANVFAAFGIISTQVKIGVGNVFNSCVDLGHDVNIGNFNFCAPGMRLLGGVKVGDLNSIGTGSVVLPHMEIGNQNKIAPLSVIYKNCKDNCLMLGNPARQMGEVK